MIVDRTISRNKKGMVLVVTITTIVLLVVLVQEIAFDTQVDLKSGVSNYTRLKAYHAAKSGLQISIIKIMVYKKAQLLISKLNPQLKSYLTPHLSTLWQLPINFPVTASEDTSDIQKKEIQEDMDESLLKGQSYLTRTESEGAKLDLNDMYSSISSVRSWTFNTFLRLLLNLREQNAWMSDNYSANDLQKIAESVRDIYKDSELDTGWLPPRQELQSLIDLKAIEGVSDEWMEIVQPYITIYGELGINLNYVPSLILKSLHPSITDQMVEDMKEKLKTQHLSSSQEASQFFTSLGMEFMDTTYFKEPDRAPALADLIFNFNAPHNFKITNYGLSGKVSHGIEAVFFDSKPTIIRAFNVLEKERQKRDNRSAVIRTTTSPVKYEATPFIIEWKDIN